MNDTVDETVEAGTSSARIEGRDQSRQPIVVRARETLSARAQLIRTHYSQRERIKRAALACLSLWALALAAVAVPIAHFVLVPLLLLAGPLAAYLYYRASEAATRAKGQCPLCEQRFKLKLQANAQLPCWDVCPRCRGHIQLRAAPAAERVAEDVQ